jgi:hypothetical protein
MGLLKIRNAADDGWIEIGGFATLPGYVNRPKFEYKDANEVTVGPGQYHHAGTTTQMVYWTSGLDITVSATGADWDYLYIDDSAVVTAGTSLLTASELIFSTTEPIWSDAKMGWYNGNDRCIFAVYCTGAATQLPFNHDGGRLVSFEDNQSIRSTADLDTTWTDVTAICPKGCGQVEVGFESYCTDGTPYYAYWRKDGQTGTSGHFITYMNNAGDNSDSNGAIARVMVSTGGVFEVKHSVSSDGQLGCKQVGWYLGRGF